MAAPYGLNAPISSGALLFNGKTCLAAGFRIFNGAPEEIRTPDPQIRSPLHAIISNCFQL